MKLQFKADKIYDIFAIVPTIEIYTCPKGLWHEGSQGLGIAFRLGYWVAGMRIYKSK